MKRLSLLLSVLLLTGLPFASRAETGDCVVTVHGILLGSWAMRPIADQLMRDGFTVVNLDYPSTQHEIDALVKDHLIPHLPKECLSPERKVHFVGHSMGGLLIREWLHRKRPANLGRVVMLGTPNHGSEVADAFREIWAYQTVFGPAGQQLGTSGALSYPVDYELGIIAGSSTIDPIGSSIIPGEDDGRVSVASTKLKGMKDHVIVPYSHMLMLRRDDVAVQVSAFLRHGKFIRKTTK